MKYKVKVHYMKYLGEPASKYIVKIEDKRGSYWGRGIVVKNKSDGLYPEYRDEKACEINDSGNNLHVTIGNVNFILDYAQKEYLLAALMALAEHDKDVITVKEKI